MKRAAFALGLAWLLVLAATASAQFPVTGVLDTCARTENPLSDNGRWVNIVVAGDGSFQDDGAHCTVISTNFDASAYRNDQVYGPDTDVFVTVFQIPSSDNGTVSLYARLQGAGLGTGTPNGYVLDVRFLNHANDPDNWRFFRVDNGVRTFIGSSVNGPNVASGDRIGISLVGSTFTGYLCPGGGACTAVATRTDTTYPAAGKIGMVGVGGTTLPLLTNFGGGTRGGADTVPPTDPTNLVATATGSTSVSLTWTASTDNVMVVNYRVERAPFSGACGTFAEVAQPTTTSQTDTPASGSYCYRVRAWDGTNFSLNYSNIATVTTLPVRTIKLAWDDNSPNTQNTTPETGFQIERCAGAACANFAPVATVGQNVVAYTDPVSPSPVACYRVTALPLGSGYSNQICSVPQVPVAVLSTAPPAFTFNASVGSSPPTQALTISNGGGTGMAWTIADSATWLSVAPTSGTDNAVVTVTVNVAGLVAGTYFGTITVSAPGATGSPATIPVTLILTPVTTPSSGSSGRIR